MSGIGRGRGWLNINKNANTKPGIHSPVESTITNFDYSPTVIATPPPKLNPKHVNIISKISLFNDNDDGILMNQKLKHIIEEFQKDCQSQKDVEETFVSIHENCLYDADFATKAIGMAATASFNKVNVHGVKLRNLFIAQFQKDFEGSKQMQASNPKSFRNCVKMLGDFYHKARLVNGQPFKFLSSPMLKYLDMLLESSAEVDLQLFTVLLYMNGNGIKDELPSKISDMLIQVRNMLAHNDRLTSTAKLWLMMALDISNNRYNMLPADLHQFYLTQLGDDSMARIKKLHTELSIQTSYQNVTLDSIHSNVNVLQQVSNISDSSWDSPSSTTTLDSDKQPATTNTTTTSAAAAGTDMQGKYANKPRNFKNSDAGFNNIGTWEQPKSEKTPRPILGAGSRLKSADPKPEEPANWRERKTDNEWKDNSNWGDNKQKKSSAGWNSAAANNKPRPKASGKGWEHDDRFENDY